MTIPFDLINDGSGFFSLKYSIGYSLGEPDLREISSEIPILPLDQNSIFFLSIFNKPNLFLLNNSQERHCNNLYKYKNHYYIKIIL